MNFFISLDIFLCRDFRYQSGMYFCVEVDYVTFEASGDQLCQHAIPTCLVTQENFTEKLIQFRS
jgi:hypothetical protein